MVRKTKDDAAKTRQAIINAAEQLFYTNGVVRTSLHDVAMAAGVTRGAVYWHFKDKLDLLLTIADTLYMPHEDLLDRLVAEDSDDPLGVLHTTCCVSMNAMANDPTRRRVFTILTQRCEYIEEMAELVRRNHACRDRLFDRLVVLFTQAHKKKKLSPIWEPLMAAQVFHSMLYGFVHMEMEWSKPSRKRDQVRSDAFAAFFKSVSA